MNIWQEYNQKKGILVKKFFIKNINNNGGLMARFFIQLEHEEDVIACSRAVQTLLKTGSHFLTNAEFGCKDGDHKAYLIVDVENKDEARAILPPDVRTQAKIVQLNRFSLEEIDAFLKRH
jgi:hypothetical protein